MSLERSFPVPVAGEGRPDYSSSIAAIKRGETYTQFEPRADEKMKIFLAAYSAAHPLAAGATDPLIDFETFLPAIPYTSPVGWRADFREWMFTFNGAVRLDTVSNDFPALVLEIYPQPNYLTHTYEQIIFFDTIYWDPLSLNAHGWNFTITNVGANPVRGAVQVAMVLTDIASEYPEEKRVRCLACGNENTVPLRETRIKCEKCGATFCVPFFPGRVI